MELYLNPKGEHGTRPEAPKNALVDEVTAVSRSLAKTQIGWSPEEKKLFVMCLTQIRWAEGGNSNIVELDKREIVECLALDLDSRHWSRYLREAFQKLARDSMVHWTDPVDKELWEDAFLITGMRSTRGKIKVTINPQFMPHLENLVKNTPYLTIWSTDVYGFKSRFSFALFEELRLHYDNRFINNYRTYSTQQLKELFGLSKDDYMRPKEKGGFDRSNFEKRVLDVAISEINRTKMMAILPNGTNRKGMVFYKKVKKNGYVTGYEFRYLVRTSTTPPSEEEY